MKSHRALLFYLTIGAATSDAQPVIAENGVMNAASYGVLQAPGAGIAPGSIFVVMGTGLGPERLQQAAEFPLGTELARTSIRIGPADAFLVYTSAAQVAAIAPATLRPGLYELTLTYNGRTSAARNVPVTTADFGIFTRNSAGYGQAAAQTVLRDGSVLLLGLASAVGPGDPVVLYGTGLGAIPGAPDDRPPGAARSSVPVEVAVGGRVVSPDYAGRSPAYPGLDQINFFVPSDTGIGCYVAVGVRANGRLSNVVTLPVAATGRSCAHPFGLSSAAMERLDARSSISAALAIMERQSRSEGAGIGFAEMSPDDVESFAAPVADPYQPPAVPGTCVALPDDRNRTIPFRPSLGRPRYLDAGLTVTLSGPSFSTDLSRTPGSTYGSNLAAGTLRAGTWNYSATGGADIGAFRIAVDLAEPVAWTNPPARVDRQAPLRIEWSGGGAEPVRILVSAGTPSASGTVICTARAQDRAFIIPAEMIATLPPASMGGLSLTQRRTRSGFSVPLARGGFADGTEVIITDQSSASIQVQ